MNLKYLDAVKLAVEWGPETSWEEIAERAGVSRKTMWRWRQDPEFQDMLREMTDRAVSEWIPQIDRAMLKEARSGSVGAAQQLYQRAGRTVQVHRDEALDKFMEALEDRDREELEFYVEHGKWPEDADNVVEGPEGVQ